MSEGIEQKPECEHAWAHKSTSVGLWVPQCYLCGEFNNADLSQQIAKVKADALREAADEYAGSDREQTPGVTSVLIFMHHRAERLVGHSETATQGDDSA